MVTTLEQCLVYIIFWIFAITFTAIFVKAWETIEKSRTFKRTRAKLGWFLLKHFYPLEYTKLKAEMNRRAENEQKN